MSGSLFLQRLDASPLPAEFPFDFNQWLSVLIDQLNEVIREIEQEINDNIAPHFTQSQITSMASNLSNGVVLYDTTNDVYVGKADGSLVQFNTSSYP